MDTQKKWVVRDYETPTETGSEIAVEGEAGYIVRDIYGRTLEEAEANARLIAAAPDMLAALERWEKWANQHGGPDVQGIACDTSAAIAKARGES